MIKKLKEKSAQLPLSCVSHYTDSSFEVGIGLMFKDKISMWSVVCGIMALP